MNKIRNLLFMAVLLCSSVTGVWAGRALVIELQSGGTVTFVLSQKPEVSFSNHVLHLSMDGSNTDFEIADVSQLYFAEDVQSIETSTKENSIRITYRSNDKVIVEGLSDSDHVRLYSSEGVKYAERVSVSAGRAEVSLQSLPKGIYLINIKNKQTFKIQRK